MSYACFELEIRDGCSLIVRNIFWNFIILTYLAYESCYDDIRLNVDNFISFPEYLLASHLDL
jgi:hypothetical protein